jgi:D-aminoacyl-tRNA deacylase
VERVRSDYEADKVKDGVFAAMMNVALENDGPVTWALDSETGSRNSFIADAEAL